MIYRQLPQVVPRLYNTRNEEIDPHKVENGCARQTTRFTCKGSGWLPLWQTNAREDCQQDLLGKCLNTVEFIKSTMLNCIG